MRLGIPEHQIGKLFSVRSFALYGCRPDGSREKIVPTESGQVMPPLMQLTGLIYLPDVDDGIFVVDDKEPQVLHFLFAEQEKAQEYTTVDCEVLLAFSSRVGTQTLAVLLNDNQQQLTEIKLSRAWQTVLKLRKIKEKIAALIGR